MQQSEITQRVIGILTKGAEWQRLLNEDPDRTDIQTDGTVDEFVREILPRTMDVPGDASPEVIANAVVEEMRPAIGKMIAGFVAAFMELADEHDSTQPEVTSTDVLRALALRAPDFDD
ncbi:hypothetical protein [Streptomyces sp. NPDC059271]|uniref:hypothetical protein n=1 Tax=Streptomyces sp. NPDC059271 TaxID=3346799 RepID=UPI0036AA7B30